jgi:hypothetical protein
MPFKILSALLGLWLMTAPSVFSFNKTVADNNHIIGPVIASFAIISFSPCTSAVRKFNILLATWLLLAPWILGYENSSAIVNDTATGVLVLLLSLTKVKIKKRFGGGWTGIWKSGSLHEAEAKQKRDEELEMP